MVQATQWFNNTPDSTKRQSVARLLQPYGMVRDPRVVLYPKELGILKLMVVPIFA